MRRQHTYRNIVQRVSIVSYVLILSLLIIGFLGRWIPFLDVVVHFRVQYVAALSVLLVWFLYQHMWRWMLSTGIALLFILPGVIRYFMPTHGGCIGKPISILSFNVFTPNQNKDGVVRLVREAHADIVLLIEVDQKWQQAFESLRAEYPFSVWVPRDDNFGIGLMARIKVEKTQEQYFGRLGVPSFVAEARTDDLSLLLVGTHTMPPYNPALSNHRDLHLADISGYLKSTGRQDIILAGDLNITPWSAPMQGLRQVGLRDTRLGHGLLPTWMTSNPLIAIPLDHVLIGPALFATRAQVLGREGSDHNALLVDVCRRAPLITETRS